MTRLGGRKSCLVLPAISAPHPHRMFLAPPAHFPLLQVHTSYYSPPSRCCCTRSSHPPLSGQTSESTCLPCSSSQSCPGGTSVPTEKATPITAAQIAAISCSAVAFIVAVFFGVTRIYPAVKVRIAKLREAGITPTLMRIVFFKRALANNMNTRLI